jgi:Cellulase (glycosyl hydrolase family 5)
VSKSRLKLLIFLALALLALVGMAAAVAATTRLLAYFQRGADPASALNIVPNVPPDLGVDLAWLPTIGDIGRTPDAFSQTQIAQGYERAWLEWNVAYVRATDKGLPTAFTGPALRVISDAVSDAAEQGWRVTQVDTGHRLRLTFYSADGSVATLRDEASVEVRIVRDPRGQIVLAEEVRSTYDVVMLLEDGRWRIRHITRVAVERLDRSAPLVALQPLPGAVAPVGAQLLRAGQPYRVVGMNYYPQATPWDGFWSKYSAGIIDADFARMRGLGLNTIRIFIPYEQFGGMHVRPEMLDRLADLLDRAEASGLQVVVTLFDFRGDYNPLIWPQADRHLETILTRFRDHPAILAWDLKNEPDLDYARAGREVVDLWLLHTLQLARGYAPHQMITVGWGSADAAAAFGGSVDLLSFHDYLPPDGLLGRYALVRQAAPGRPVILGEFGLPTWNSPFFPNGHTEAEQLSYYAAVLSAMRSTDAAGEMAWTLYDFSSVPANVAGRMPWQVGPQRQLGVLRADGTPKPAAALFAPGARLDPPAAAPWARLLKPFWVFYGLLALIAGLTLVRYRVRIVRWLAGGWRRRLSARAADPLPDDPPAADRATASELPPSATRPAADPEHIEIIAVGEDGVETQARARDVRTLSATHGRAQRGRSGGRRRRQRGSARQK